MGRPKIREPKKSETKIWSQAIKVLAVVVAIPYSWHRNGLLKCYCHIIQQQEQYRGIEIEKLSII